MKILILLRDGATNGITTYNRVLARELVSQGHEVRVWPDPEMSLRSPVRAQFQGVWMRPAFEWLLRHKVAQFGPDLVYVSHFTQARLAQKLKETLGIPWFACMHNGHSPSRMAEWAQLLRGANGLVTMCENLHDLYAPLAGARPAIPQLLSRLPLPLPTPQAAARPAKRLVLTYCARLSSQKGPRCEAWLRAIALLPRRGDFEVRVIGGGSHLSRLKQVAGELGLQAQFVGLVPDPAPYLETTHVIAGAGYALMEGLVRGCVGVGLGFGGCWGVVIPDRWGEALAVNFGDHCPHPLPDDPPSIAAALSEAIDLVGTEPAHAVAMRCRQVFDPAPIARELAEFWRSAVTSAA